MFFVCCFDTDSSHTIIYHTNIPSAILGLGMQEKERYANLVLFLVIPTDQGDEAFKLDPKLTFRDYGITTSRILALRYVTSAYFSGHIPCSTHIHYLHSYMYVCILLRIKEGKRERLPNLPIPVPDWVLFHQSWLSITQGNQPCSIQDAITVSPPVPH